MTGASAWIDLNPAGTGSANIIDITPSASLSGVVTWRGIYILGAALDPDAAATIVGEQIDLTGVDLSNNPDVVGITVTLPATYAAGTEYAGYFGGDGKVVKICEDTYAVWVDAGQSRFDDDIILGTSGFYINETGTAVLHDATFQPTGLYGVKVEHQRTLDQISFAAVPQNAINTASSVVRGFYMDGAALDPAAASVEILGVQIDLSGVDLTNNPDVYGVHVKLPATYAAGLELAGYFSGDGKVVKICDDTYALWVDDGQSRFDGIVNNPVDNSGFYTGAGNDLRIYHDGSDSYIYNSTGQLRIYEGVQNQLVIIAGGNATNDGANLTLFGSTHASADVVRFRAGGTETMRISASGDVGIGEASPTWQLHVKTSAYNDGVTIESTEASNSHGPRLKLYRNSASPADDDLIGLIQFWGEDSVGNDQQYAAIGCKIKTVTSGVEDGQILWYITAGGSTITPMWLDYHGYLNINYIRSTTDSDHHIHLDPTADQIHFYPGDTSTDRHIIFESTANASSNPKITPDADNYGYNGTSSLTWYYAYHYHEYRHDETAIDELDDLAIIDAMDVQRNTKGEVIRCTITNMPMMDLETYPDWLTNKHDPEYKEEDTLMVNGGMMSSLLRGAVKQLHQKVIDLTEVVTLQGQEIAAQKAEINILKGIN